MKKLSKVAALLATGALLLGGAFLSCSSDGLPPQLGGGSGGGGGDGGSGGAGGSGGSSGDSGESSSDLATVKYLTLASYSSNSSDVTPDWKAEVSNTSLVTASDLTWTLVSGLTHSQWDVKLGNNSVTEAQLEEQTTGDYEYSEANNYFATVSFTITAVKNIKLKKISAITSSGKTPSALTCYVDNVKKAAGEAYSSSAEKAQKLADADLGDILVAAGSTATIKLVSEKDQALNNKSDVKIDFGQIALTVMDATATEVAVTGVAITSADNVTELEKGASTTLTATVTPSNATSKTVTWSITGADGTSTTTAATVENGKVTAGTVDADTVVKVFATAGGVKSEPYSITIKADTAPKLPTVTLFNYSATTANLTDVTIENAADDFVTISNVSFVAENNSQNISWLTDYPSTGSNEPGVGNVNSALQTAAGTTGKIGYTAKTANESSETNNSNVNKGGSIAKVSFTVTPKAAAKLVGVEGYLRYAGSSKTQAKVTIGSHTYQSTADDTDTTSRVAHFVDEISDLTASADAFTVEIQFVAGDASTAFKKNQQFDIFNVQLIFEE